MNRTAVLQSRGGIFFPLAATAAGIAVALVIAQISAGIAAGLVIGALLVLAGLAHFEVLIHAMIVLLPLQSALPFSLKSMGTLNPFNLLAAAVFAVWLVNGILRRQRLLNWSWMNLCILLFIAAAGLAWLNTGRLHGSHFMQEQLNPLKRWLSPMLLFFPIANGNFSRRAIRRMIYLTMVMVFVVAVWMTKDIIDYGLHNLSSETRLGGPFGFGGENDIAAFFVYYPILALTLGLSEKSLLKRAFLLGSFTLAMFPLLLSMSRGAYLGMGCILVFVAVMRFRWLLPVLLVAALTYQFWVPGTVKQRFQSTVISENETVGGRVPGPNEPERNLEESAAQRIRIWRGAVRMIAAHPLTGIGYNAFQLAVPRYANMEWGLDAHNMYLRVGAEMGVAGLVIFLSLLLLPFWMCRQLYRTSRNRFIRGWMLGMMACMLGIAIVNIFGSRFVREELIGLYWIVVGLAYAYQFMRENRLATMRLAKLQTADRDPVGVTA